MESLTGADIFFIIAAVVLVVVTTLLTTIAIQLIKLIHDVRQFLRIFGKEAEHIIGDIEEFRDRIKDKAGVLSKFVGAFTTAKVIRFLTKK